MPTQSNRIDRIFHLLSAQDRAIEVLLARKEGREEHPDLRNTMPPSQTYEFKRLERLMVGANSRTMTFIAILDQLVDKLMSRAVVVAMLDILQDSFSDLTRLLAEADTTPPTEIGETAVKRSGARPTTREEEPRPHDDDKRTEEMLASEKREFHEMFTSSTLGVFVGARGGTNRLSDWQHALRSRLEGLSRQYWQEARALEIAWEEIANELNGQDPVHPVLRSSVDQIKQKLRVLRAELGLTEAESELEPDFEDIKTTRELVLGRPGQMPLVYDPAWNLPQFEERERAAGGNQWPEPEDSVGGSR